MSNHSGGYMLNGFLHGLVDCDILKSISDNQKKSIRRLLRRAASEYDCNWPEIVDVELAVLLAACSCCGCDSTEINTENGYCVRCDQLLQQGNVLGGERDLLYQLLKHRFGSLPRWVSDRMQDASEKDFFDWGVRLLDDPSSLEEVFKKV